MTYFLNFFRKIAVIIIVAITDITLATIEGNLKPSGACNIYPKVIKVHTMAGANVIMYGLFFWIKYTVAESKTATAVIN